MSKVYLAGLITGYPKARKWRQKARELLNPVVTINPMDYEVDYDRPSQIVAQDFALIKDCNVLLLDARDKSWGSAMELMYAFGLGKTTIAWGAPNPISPWLKAHTYNFYPNLEQACWHIKKAYNNG